MLISYRTSTQAIKSPGAGAKVTFAELPPPPPPPQQPSSDGQNKENDQPDEPMPPQEDEEKQFEAPQNNGKKNGVVGVDNDDGQAKIIPWRAQLRKTNSTLNLLE